MRWLAPLALIGCGTLSAGRPLDPGRHEVGVVLGGPMLQLFGGTLPLPNAVVAGRSGLGRVADRPLDLGYGINLTGLPLGVLAVHADTGWLLTEQAGARPALSARTAGWLSTNALAPGKLEDTTRAAHLVHELELTASWQVDAHQLWLSASQYTDARTPALTLTPALGGSLDFGEPGGLRLIGELSWYAINRSTDLRTVRWVPARPGAIGLHLGVAHGFGRSR